MRKARRDVLEKETEEVQKRDAKLADLEKDLAKAERKLQKELAKESKESKVVKAERNYEKDVAKIREEMEEERNKCDDKLGKKSRKGNGCLLYTSPSPRDGLLSRMPSSA